MKRKSLKKNTIKKSEYLAEVLERTCAKPQLGSRSQLCTGFPTGLLPAPPAATSRMALFNLDLAWKREKRKKKKSGVRLVSAGLYQGVPPSAVPQTHCWLLKTLQMQILRGLDFYCESLYALSLGFFFSFSCIENAFRRLTLHFWYPEVSYIN